MTKGKNKKTDRPNNPKQLRPLKIGRKEMHGGERFSKRYDDKLDRAYIPGYDTNDEYDDE